MTEGHFLRRDNRFRVTVEVEGRPESAHLPNSGRLAELLVPGRRCYLSTSHDPTRKTHLDLRMVAYGDVLVSVDARLPNSLFAEALRAGRLDPFRHYEGIRREVRVGESRLDFRLNQRDDVCWVEVKSVTLVEDGTARFPDAPTTRGVRHLRELIRVASSGERAAVVFVVQRCDARLFVPHDSADAAFGKELRKAAGAGVGVYAWSCEVSRQAISMIWQVPVDLTLDE